MNALTRKTEQASVQKNDCTHCGLPVPKGLINPEFESQFCCSGCKVAFELIHANGLDAFYDMAEVLPDASEEPIGDPTLGFDEFDRPEFQNKFGLQEIGDHHSIKLAVDGVHCAACIWLLEKLPVMVQGVRGVQVNWAKRTLLLKWDPDVVPLSRIATTLNQLGYTPHPVYASQAEERRRAENRRQLAMIGVAAAAAGNNMLIAASIYLGMFSYMSGTMLQVLRGASCLVGLLALAWPGRVFLVGAWSAIRTRTAHMDLPIALALLIGTVVGLVNTIRGTGEIYFDSLSVLIFLLLVGRWIQFRQQNRAADAIESLYQLTPTKARKIVDGQVVETFVDLIQPGDLLEVLSDDVVPVDGVLTGQAAFFDESILTGESVPAQKQPGDEVYAGSRNQSTACQISAASSGTNTRLNKIVGLVESASQEKTEIVDWANRIGGYFVITVVALALLTFGYWFGTDVNRAVDRTVALLIIACPCALAIATPLAIAVAMGRAAKRKIVVKSGDVVQSLNKPGIIWLDKTGTVTEGRLKVVEYFGETIFLNHVVALEENSSHPIAKAIVRYVDESDRTEKRHNLLVKELENHPSLGLSGDVEGVSVAVGNQGLLKSLNIHVDDHWSAKNKSILGSYHAPVWVAMDGEVVGMFAVGDSLRTDSKEAVEQLRYYGWKVGLLSGDHSEIVTQVARELCINEVLVFGGVSPEEKLAKVNDSKSKFETVVMVGDGVNDCAALAAADVGIAVHGGAEASLATAPVYLAEKGLKPITQLLAVTQSTYRSLHLNFALSITYNVTAAVLALLGFINPLVAAILMPINSLIAVAIALPAGRVSEGGLSE